MEKQVLLKLVCCCVRLSIAQHEVSSNNSWVLILLLNRPVNTILQQFCWYPILKELREYHFICNPPKRSPSSKLKTIAFSNLKFALFKFEICIGFHLSPAWQSLHTNVLTSWHQARKKRAFPPNTIHKQLAISSLQVTTGANLYEPGSTSSLPSLSEGTDQAKACMRSFSSTFCSAPIVWVCRTIPQPFLQQSLPSSQELLMAASQTICTLATPAHELLNVLK